MRALELELVVDNIRREFNFSGRGIGMMTLTLSWWRG